MLPSLIIKREPASAAPPSSAVGRKWIFHKSHDAIYSPLPTLIYLHTLIISIRAILLDRNVPVPP